MQIGRLILASFLQVSPDNPNDYNDVVFFVPGETENFEVVRVFISIMGPTDDCEIRVKDLYIVECIHGKRSIK